MSYNRSSFIQERSRCRLIKAIFYTKSLKLTVLPPKFSLSALEGRRTDASLQQQPTKPPRRPMPLEHFERLIRWVDTVTVVKRLCAEPGEVLVCTQRSSRTVLLLSVSVKRFLPTALSWKWLHLRVFGWVWLLPDSKPVKFCKLDLPLLKLD